MFISSIDLKRHYRNTYKVSSQKYDTYLQNIIKVRLALSVLKWQPTVLR